MGEVAETSAPVEDADWLSIETPREQAPYADLLFQCMKGSDRVWACNGSYVACRPRDFHDATRSRHAKFLASGHYRHIATHDDVQIFELLPGSPFRRDNRTLIPGQNIGTDMRECAKAAVSRDWVLYHDILEAIASNIKAAYDPGTAQQMFKDCVEYITHLIYLRGGPTVAEVDAGMNSVRVKRGVGSGRVLALPPATSIARV